MCMNFLLVVWKNDDEFFISGEEKRRGVAEQEYKREADWKEAGEERSDERAWMLPDNISGTSDSEGYWYIRNILYYFYSN